MPLSQDRANYCGIPRVLTTCAEIHCATVAVSFVGSKSLSGKYHTLKVDKNAQQKPRMQMCSLLGNIIQINLVPVILITILLYC